MPFLDDGAEDLVLGGEMVVDTARATCDSFSDLPHRGGGKALLDNEIIRSRPDCLARAFAS